MKKFISILLCIMLCFSGYVFAAADGKIYINDVTAEASGEVMVSVMSEYITNLSGGSLSIVYDNKMLELISCTKGSAMEGISPYINSSYNENTIRVVWMTSGTVGQGSVCDIVFKVKEGASGSAFVNLEDVKLSDINGDAITADIKSGNVIVGKGSLEVTDARIFDYAGNPSDYLLSGSNKINTEIHNTLKTSVTPLIIYALYQEGKLVSASVKPAKKAIGENETVTVENVVNVPYGTDLMLKAVVWDGILNVKPVKIITFVSE